jgi:hypothetical protein
LNHALAATVASYCGPACRSATSRRQRRHANLRYPQSEQGREAHRRCQQRYREGTARAPVTDQGLTPITSAATTLRTCVICGRESRWINPFPAVPRRWLGGRSLKFRNQGFQMIANSVDARFDPAGDARVQPADNSRKKRAPETTLGIIENIGPGSNSGELHSPGGLPIRRRLPEVLAEPGNRTTRSRSCEIIAATCLGGADLPDRSRASQITTTPGCFGVRNEIQITHVVIT